MLQLPGMNAEEIKSYQSKLMKHNITDNTLQTFCGLGPEKRA